MSGDSQAKFSVATKTKIRKRYQNRCAICLQKLTSSGSQCAHLLDAARSGARQSDIAMDMGIIRPGYKRSSAENGMVQCPTCHLAFFTTQHVVLSPPSQVLQYIVEYLWSTDSASRKPLYEIFRLLDDALKGRNVDLPKVQSVLPFLGIYSLVILLPDELDRLQIISHHLPDLSILEGNKFITAPADTLPDAPGAARIFDALAVTDKHPETSYRIPLSPHHTEFAHQRYWRVPAKPEVVLMMLLERTRHVSEAGCEEVNHARVISGILLINKAGVEIVRRTRSRRSRHAPEEEEGEEPPNKISRRRTDKGPPSSASEKGRGGGRKKAGGGSSGTRVLRSSNPGPGRRKTLRLKI